MFAKLALRNVKRQIHNYLIYFVTVVLSVALLFAVNNLSYSDRIRQLAEISNDINAMFNMVTVLSFLVTALVLSYATAFMLKLRKKEFGMYLTLGMTRRNIRTLFFCETWLLSGLALMVGMGVGLVIFQLIVALFVSIMEFPFAVSAYSVQGILLTIAVSVGLFALSTLASMRYLKKVTISELLKEENTEKSEKHPVLWCALSVVTLSGLVGSLIITYRNLMASFRGPHCPAGSDGQFRACRKGTYRLCRQNIHARGCQRQHLRGRIHLHGGDERGGQHPQQPVAPLSCALRRAGTRHQHLRRHQHRMVDSGVYP